MIAEYVAGFSRCYPHKSIEVKPIEPTRKHPEWRYSVIIDGDKGDILLTEADVQFATRMFNLGKRH